MAQWLERATDNRVRILLRPFGNFGNFLYPTLPVSFGRDTKSRWSFLYGVYARGSKRSHQSALEMCNLSWTPPPTLRDHTSSWTTLEISLKTFVCYPVNMMCSKSNQISSSVYDTLSFPGSCYAVTTSVTSAATQGRVPPAHCCHLLSRIVLVARRHCLS